jgi:translation initiation factor 3 subunit C
MGSKSTTGSPYQTVSLVELLSDSLTVVLVEFDKLLRLVQRQSNAAEPVPPFFVKTLLSLENSLNAALTKEKEAKKKMNATNARALNSMKQKVRKTAKEFEKEVQQYQNVSFFRPLYYDPYLSQDPEAFEREFAAHAQPVDIVPKPKKQKKGADSESDGEPVLDDRFTTVGKGGKAMSFSADNIFKTLKLVHEARGKKVHMFSFVLLPSN